MRIRKNKNLSSFSSHTSGVEPHICQLNQSPWDVIPSPPSPPPPPPPPYEFLRDESYNNGNESLGDSIGAVESVWSMMNDASNNHPATTRMKVDNLISDVVDDDDNYNKITEKKIISLSEDNHEKKLIKLKKSSSEAVGSSGAATMKLRDCGKVGGKRAKKGQTTSSTANPYEFYYHSGFGPLWGRKRRGEMTSKSSTIEKATILPVNISEDMTRSSTSLIGNKSSLELVYIDDDYHGNEDSRKWTRKPVKARSLKSLMS